MSTVTQIGDPDWQHYHRTLQRSPSWHVNHGLALYVLQINSMTCSCQQQLVSTSATGSAVLLPLFPHHVLNREAKIVERFERVLKRYVSKRGNVPCYPGISCIILLLQVLCGTTPCPPTALHRLWCSAKYALP
jgi:hypothetical protein